VPDGPEGARGRLGPGRIPEELIHAVLDGDMDDRSAREIMREVGRRPEQRREVLATSAALGALRVGVATPDLTGRILAESHRRRRFLGPTLRRAVEVTRYGVAAGVLVAVGGLVTLRLVNPDALRLAPAARPIERVSAAVEETIRQPMERVRGGAEGLRAALAPVQAAGAGIEVVGHLLPGGAMGSVVVDERAAFASAPEPMSLWRVLNEDGEVVVVTKPLAVGARSWGGGWSSGGLTLVTVPKRAGSLQAGSLQAGAGRDGTGRDEFVGAAESGRDWHGRVMVRVRGGGVRLVHSSAEFIPVSGGGASEPAAVPVPRAPGLMP
jgi:hypothetical protein